MALVRLNPNKFGTYEEFELLLSRRLSQSGIRDIKVFTDYPMAGLREQLQSKELAEEFEKAQELIAQLKEERKNDG